MSIEALALNVAMIVPRTEAEGPGVRFAIWVQGCPMRCPGCCNPEMLAFVERTRRDPQELAEEAMNAGVEGVSFLGGEPFAQAGALSALAESAHARGLSVMVFSGYTIAELRAMADPGVAKLLAATDLLVDGRYEESERTLSRRWIGSSNQVLHFLTNRYRSDDPRFAAPNQIELRIERDGYSINGFPILGSRTK